MVSVVLLVAGCAMPGGRYRHASPFPSSANRAQVVEASIQVLQEHGYTPSVVNERVGTITTDWRNNDNWLALVFGHRGRDRMTVTVSDSMLTVSGEHQAKEGASLLFGLGEDRRDTDWFTTASPDATRQGWDLVGQEILSRIATLPEGGLAEKRVTSAASFATPAGESVLAAEALPADERMRIAVVEFAGIGLKDDEVLILTDRIRAELVGTGRFTVVERERMNEILSEQGFQQSELCATDDCVVEVGRLVGVDGIVSGTFGKIGETYTVTARLIDVETGEIVSRASEDCPCAVDDLLGSMRRLSVLLANRTE